MDLATRKMVYYGLLGLLIAGSAIAVFRVSPQVVPVQFLAKDGTFAVYFNSIPSDISSNQGMPNTGLSSIMAPGMGNGPGLSLFTIVSLNVTIDSIMIHNNGANDSGWMQISRGSVTIDLLRRSAVSVLLASDKVPTEDVMMVQLHVSNATAIVKDPLGLVSVKAVVVSSQTLKLPLDSGATVAPQMSTSVVADRPHIVIQGNGTIRLTPVLNVDSVSGPG